MIFKPLHFCFLAVLFVMSLGVSTHLAFTGYRAGPALLRRATAAAAPTE